MPVEVIDIRPLSSSIRGLTFIQADATHLSNIAEQSVQSLSCLHAAEHFGLGRYTDPIDSDACFKAMRAMQRVLAVGGTLYFSVPIGIERVEFNAQRVFAPKTIVSSFDGLTLECFSAVDDEGRFHPDASIESFTGARYACGLFEFRKREHAGSVPS
jgi:hypothetical protein